MFTEPKIITTDDLNSRSYVSFYYNGTRCREYNGKRLKLDISPNYAKSITERNALLQNLKYELTKALRNGWSPIQKDKITSVSLKEALTQVLADKLASNYSETYKRDLKKLHFNHFKMETQQQFIQKHIAEARDYQLAALITQFPRFFEQSIGDVSRIILQEAINAAKAEADRRGLKLDEEGLEETSLRKK